jgi:hypothetical protein
VTSSIVKADNNASLQQETYANGVAKGHRETPLFPCTRGGSSPSLRQENFPPNTPITTHLTSGKNHLSLPEAVSSALEQGKKANKAQPESESKL